MPSRAASACYNGSMTEYRIKSGLSTRVVQLTSGESVHASREALDKAARQVGSGFIPMGVEHLSYLPPRGRLTRAEVLTDSDGESELVVYGQDLTFLRAGEMSLKPAVAETDEPSPSLGNVTISAEPRNYSRDSWEEIVADSPVPVEEGVAWSDLPPLIWTLSIPVTWAAVRFAGSFFDRLGDAAADRFITWLNRAAKAAKNPDRETLVEIRFDLGGGGHAILGFAPLNAASEASVAALRAAIDQAGLLAEFAGSVVAGQQPAELRRCSFVWDSNQWRLAWWATDEAVHVTPWFSENYPDPQRFLGRPLLLTDNDDEDDLGHPHLQG
jgi:hypothetical protein